MSVPLAALTFFSVAVFNHAAFAQGQPTEESTSFENVKETVSIDAVTSLVGPMRHFPVSRHYQAL